MYRFIAPVLVFVYTLLTAFSVVLCAPFDYTCKASDFLVRLWAVVCLRLFKVRTIRPEKKIEIEGPVVMMSNHQSNMDPMLLISEIPLVLRFVFKTELFFVPFVGLALWKMGHIPVNRGNREKAIESMRRAAQKIRKGTHVLVFPEGTRSKDPQTLLPFKKGGFMLAIEAGVPILPIGISGTGRCWPKGSSKAYPGDISYCVGEPIPTENLTFEERDELMEKVKNAIERLREEAEKRIEQKNKPLS